MIVIQDERNDMDRKPLPDEICENCGKNKISRTVQAIGMLNIDRGSYRLCYDCEGPHIFWKRTLDSDIVRSPTWGMPRPRSRRLQPQSG
jgi:hypothetical protein